MINTRQFFSFSGGKDSTAMLIKAIELNEPIEDIVMFDTGWEFPEMHEHIKKVESYIDMENSIKYEKGKRFRGEVKLSDL
jgi:3'-phosphoadenosine 5'-phosphosulfate sulfotransferase (PAPS reductase)/FAD synthetase